MAKLIITDKAKFDEEVWQTKTDFNAEKYAQWLRTAIDNLQAAKETLEEQGCDNSVDPYVLGDIANMLCNLQVEVREGNAIDERIPDEVIYKEFHDRGLWEDDDIFIFGIDTMIDFLEEQGYTVCAPSE